MFPCLFGELGMKTIYQRTIPLSIAATLLGVLVYSSRTPTITDESAEDLEEVIVVSACRYASRDYETEIPPQILSDDDWEALAIKHENWAYAIEETRDITLEDLPRDFDKRPDFFENSTGRLDLNQLNLSGKELPDLNLVWSDLPNASFEDAQLRSPNFSNAFMPGTLFDYAVLESGYFYGTHLKGASFLRTALNDVDFSHANLEGAQFSGAEIDGGFTEANLANAEFHCATVTEIADFDGASLKNASLQDVVFEQEVSFQQTDLEGTNFSGVEFLEEVFYEPVNRVAPTGFSTVVGLEKLTFDTSPQGLIAVRDALRKDGHKDQAAILTYTIRHRSTERALESDNLQDQIDGIFQTVFFDWPVAYGSKPGRPLIALLFGIFVFAIPYYINLITLGRDGIWQVWPASRVRQDLGNNEPKLIRLRWWEAPPMAIYFSLLSAFHIGWRDLNVGTWISRLQPREHTYMATGWVRTVSGLQSLLSVYFLALWALSYFGAPFG